ncbi:hypothetical protein COLO4_35767 [Corchorus olitorius]|uniref:Uncharacterized protein n=1 Tax=Corchorus olitorius TaxID=93759 RepID=A0A1R3GDK3_9ROSI|nr:hypothetical protein COLO4_35767 [Corchorus olitorius]
MAEVAEIVSSDAANVHTNFAIDFGSVCTYSTYSTSINDPKKEPLTSTVGELRVLETLTRQNLKSIALGPLSGRKHEA